MKLIYCKKCYDVVKLDYEVRSCKCGESRGKYLRDGYHALYAGECFPIGIANQSLANATVLQPTRGAGARFEAFVIEKECTTFIKVGDECEELRQKSTTGRQTT